MNIELQCFGFVASLDPNMVEALIVMLLVLLCRPTRSQKSASSNRKG